MNPFRPKAGMKVFALIGLVVDFRSLESSGRGYETLDEPQGVFGSREEADKAGHGLDRRFKDYKIREVILL